MFEKEPVRAAGVGAGAALKQAQLIYAALMGGVVVFAVIVASGITGGGGGGGPAGAGAGMSGTARSVGTALGILCVVLPVTVIPMALLARKKLMRAALTVDDPDPVRFQAVLISGAVLESMGLFGCVVWMITGEPLPGAILVGFTIIGMAALFPKRREFENPGERGADGEGDGDAEGRSFERPERWS